MCQWICSFLCFWNKKKKVRNFSDAKYKKQKVLNNIEEQQTEQSFYGQRPEPQELKVLKSSESERNVSQTREQQTIEND